MDSIVGKNVVQLNIVKSVTDLKMEILITLRIMIVW